ncbi:MAG: arylsulfatase, partial [Myxococcota bacterium]
RKWSMPLGDDDRRAMVTKYLARVSMVDALVGRVIEGLAESGQLDNTWVVFGADHGELLGDKNLIGKIAFFDGSVRVPLIMRPPGGSVGWTASGWCDQLDVTATLLALGGLDPRIHLGVPLHDAVLGGPGQFTGKSTVVSEVADYSMVLDDRYKAVVDRRTQTVAELYDRVEDPGEWENRVGDASLEGVRRAAIDQLAHLTGADS